MLECVVNISEGRDPAVLDALAGSCGADLLDVHLDPVHNRSVFTLVGTEAPRNLTRIAVRLLNLEQHRGVHPRLGVVDVVPFVALEGSTMADAVAARDAFAHWVVDELGVPVFLYGPGVDGHDRSLPEIRRRAFGALEPDLGPVSVHPSAGAVCVGARDILIAFNVWLDASTPREVVARIAADVRGDGVRTLALVEGDLVQVSMNLVAVDRVGPAEAYDRVVEKCNEHGAIVRRAELVGLLPRRVLDRIPGRRWTELDLAAERTIEARLESGGHGAT